MSPLLLSLILITQSGEVKITPHLTPHECSEARSLALYNMTEEEKTAADAKLTAELHQREEELDKAQAAWEAENPGAAETCAKDSLKGLDCGPKGYAVPSISSGTLVLRTPDEARYAECIEP